MFLSGPNNQNESSDDSYHRECNLSDCTGTKPKFKFPPPPRLSFSVNNSLISSQSDSSNDGLNYVKKKRNKAGFAKRLPPLGIFWDIENCQVPKSKSASAVVQKFRSIFLENYRESEFLVVCDVKKEHPQIIQELHDSQVNLIHVSSTSKNAADEKLRQSLRRFAEVHPAPSGIVLISGDINFAADLSDLRYRKKIRVILVHHVNVADALILCANEHHSFVDITENLPPLKAKVLSTPSHLLISNLPQSFSAKKIKNRLKLLTDNCGGRVTDVCSEEGTAYVKFCNQDAAQRAQRRIQGEDVYGNKIQVLTPAARSYTGRKVKNGDASFQSTGGYQGPAPSPGFSHKDGQNYPYFNQSRDKRHLDLSASSENNGMFRPIRGMGSTQNGTPMDVSYDQSWGGRRNVDRRSRTPQDSLSAAACALPGRVHKISASSDFSDDGNLYYSSADSAVNKPIQANQPVDLFISNLDSTIEIKELRRLLTNMLKEFAMILSLNIVIQSDGNPIANIRVNSQQEAQFTISQLHRQKLGNKRIIISYAQSNSPDPDQLKAMVIGLLQEVPDKCMPLFKFIELLESRYHCFVSVSELKKLKDICKVTDDLGPRIISLTQEIQCSPPPNLSRTLVPYCAIHCTNLQSRGWCEISNIQTPSIIMSLKLFATKLIGLLSGHLGSMSLLSFQTCYELEYHEPLPVDDAGVSLEHLISCVPNIEIKCVGPNKNIKVITQENHPTDYTEETVLKTVPLPLAPNISLICRELVDLLKTTEKCQLLLNKFIPAYHHHFGRQCRVADYGYTKLLDLFESIPHIIQIMGDGTRKVITLSHTAQMRRFTSDLLRVLKVQPLKQITITEFPSAYEKVMNKTFNAVEYGLCMFEDLLQEVPENTIVISKGEEGILISVPKREQTAEEIMRTKQFAAEVIDLLKHAPYYTILFNKFVPAYHHHFGHQCKVSDYGFTKLIELFEAIPDIVKIDELSDGERVVSLTLEQSIKVLGSQITQAIKSSKMSSLQLEDLPTIYLRECGYPLKAQVYECETVSEVVEKLSDYIEVIHSNAGTLLVAIDMDTIPTLLVRGWALLLKSPHSKDLPTFKYEYQSRYNSSFSMSNIQELENVFLISSRSDTNFISLTTLYVLAAQLYHVLYKNGGSVPFDNLEKLYFDYYGKPMKISNYNIYSIDEFYNKFNSLFFIRGKKKSVVVLKRNLAEHLVPLPPSIFNSSHYSREVVQWPSLPSIDVATPCVKKVSPPKPDTPPTPGNAPWSHWLTSPNYDSGLSLSIHMPIMHNPQLLANPDSLISPAKLLLPSNRNPWATPSIAAPHPTELPMPDKLMVKEGMSDDSADSGVNTKLDNSPSDTELDAFHFEKYFERLPSKQDVYLRNLSS